MAHTELNLRERRAIEDMLNAKMSADKIANELGRHRSTVFREIKRNRFVNDELPKLGGYYGMNAQRSAAQRRARRRKKRQSRHRRTPRGLVFPPIGQSTNDPTTLRRVRHSANGKVI